MLNLLVNTDEVYNTINSEKGIIKPNDLKKISGGKEYNLSVKGESNRIKSSISIMNAERIFFNSDVKLTSSEIKAKRENNCRTLFCSNSQPNRHINKGIAINSPLIIIRQ